MGLEYDPASEPALRLCRGSVRASAFGTRKVDVRLPGKENSNSRGARPVHLIITMIKWIQTSRLSIEKSLSVQVGVSETSKRFRRILGQQLSQAKPLKLERWI